uniref:Uncharacterized protein n=1 Tax=Rhabditophanes sp. KR3021 TaxID=114890 RepID=A0AC35UCQ4_9BILA
MLRADENGDLEDDEELIQQRHFIEAAPVPEEAIPARDAIVQVLQYKRPPQEQMDKIMEVVNEKNLTEPTKAAMFTVMTNTLKEKSNQQKRRR